MARCPHDQGPKAKLEKGTGLLLPEGSEGLGTRVTLRPQIISGQHLRLTAATDWGRARGGTTALGAALLLALSIPSLAAGQAASSGAAPAAEPSTSPPALQTPAPAPAASQPAPTSQVSPTGWLAFEQLQYGVNNLGTVIIEDTDLGYGFTDHTSADIGLPVLFTRSPFSPVLNHDYYWSALLGDPYVDVKYTNSYHDFNYTSVLTGTGPVRNSDKIYTTGRPGVDWFNHVEEPLGNVTPFVNFGASNGALNHFIMPRPYLTARPYETLGFLGDGEVGLEYKFTRGHARGVTVGVSGYALLPAGKQKVFSRYVFPYSSLAGDGHHDRYFDSSFETKSNWVSVNYSLLTTTTTGTIQTTLPNSKLDRDNGLSGWVEITRWHNLDVQLAYTRSVHYDLDIYTATFTFDARELLSSVIPHRH